MTASHSVLGTVMRLYAAARKRGSQDEAYLRLAILTITLGRANSSLKRWLCSISRRSLSSCMVALLARAAAEDMVIDTVRNESCFVKLGSIR